MSSIRKRSPGLGVPGPDQRMDERRIASGIGAARLEDVVREIVHGCVCGAGSAAGTRGEPPWRAHRPRATVGDM